MLAADWLSSLKVSDILPSDVPIVILDATETLEETLKKLVSHNIYSAPVWDGTNSKYLGTVDLVDIITFLARIFCNKAKIESGKGKQTIEQFSVYAFQKHELQELKEEFFNQPIIKIINLSGQNAYQPLPLEGTTLRDVILLLIRADVARVPLLDKSGKVARICSQSSLISYFTKHLDKLGTITNLTVDQAKIATKPMITVPPELRAIDAFMIMSEYKISGLAYLGEEGEVLGNISVKDIKGVVLDFFNLVHTTVDYIGIVRRESIRDTFPLVNIHETDPIGKVIAKLAAVGIHRLYLFGSSKSPIGIVSLHDVTKLIAREF